MLNLLSSELHACVASCANGWQGHRAPLRIAASAAAWSARLTANDIAGSTCTSKYLLLLPAQIALHRGMLQSQHLSAASGGPRASSVCIAIDGNIRPSGFEREFTQTNARSSKMQATSCCFAERDLCCRSHPRRYDNGWGSRPSQRSIQPGRALEPRQPSATSHATVAKQR